MRNKMDSNDVAPVSAWEQRRFDVETQLKERELQLTAERLKTENRRNILIGALVPIVIAIMTAVPT
jgi:beta-lactamase regulating signal transducer with metallopeptidase domain